MTTLNTIIEEEKKEFDKQYGGQRFVYANELTIQDFLATSMQRAYEAGRTDTLAKIPMLRQWLNEDKITDVNRMVTNEQIRYWLIGEE